MTPWVAASRPWVAEELTTTARLTGDAWLAPGLPEYAAGLARGAQVWGLLLLQRWLATELGEAATAASATPPPGTLQPSL
jgi:hypothetical protein